MLGSFSLEGDLVEKVGLLGPAHKRDMVAAANHVAPQAESYMRENAPWTDRTGNARRGLMSKVEVAPVSVTIVLYHTVPYGVWLETRWSGKFQIIRPTMEKYVKVLIEEIGALMFK